LFFKISRAIGDCFELTQKNSLSKKRQQNKKSMKPNMGYVHVCTTPHKTGGHLNPSIEKTPCQNRIIPKIHTNDPHKLVAYALDTMGILNALPWSVRAGNQAKWRAICAIASIVLLFGLKLASDSAHSTFVGSIGRRLLDDGDNSTCVNPGSQPNPCVYVMENCGDIPTFINYLEVHYCYLGNMPALSFIAMVRHFAEFVCAQV
jgi:hypothetical protein